VAAITLTTSVTINYNYGSNIIIKTNFWRIFLLFYLHQVIMNSRLWKYGRNNAWL